MTQPPKKLRNLDQGKAGLQDDHDPRDPAQRQNDKPGGIQPADTSDTQTRNPRDRR